MSAAGVAPAFLVPDRCIVRRGINTAVPEVSFLDPGGAVIAFSRQTVKQHLDDIRLYADPSTARELLQVRSRNITGDWNNTFELIDSPSQEKIGGIGHRGWRSFVQDEWALLDTRDREIGRVRESFVRAVVRRWLMPFLPQTYALSFGGETIGRIRHNWSPTTPELDVDLTSDKLRRLDRRLLAGALLLIATFNARGETGRLGPHGW